GHTSSHDQHEHLPLVEARNRLSEVVDRLEREHGRVVITKHGRPAVVMLSLADLESLEETLDLLSDSGLVAEIREAQAEVATGRTRGLTRDEAKSLTA
ncbi:MAG: type II toxin-antitoxin system Phd/YefM family antitoxin, partial [Sporichthyaceae bacterium]|nr:type II toxin-antitoxin system Phd/YefM family antitoxin [Sporichthyaceae bacterium]